MTFLYEAKKVFSWKDAKFNSGGHLTKLKQFLCSLNSYFKQKAEKGNFEKMMYSDIKGHIPDFWGRFESHIFKLTSSLTAENHLFEFVLF